MFRLVFCRPYSVGFCVIVVVIIVVVVVVVLDDLPYSVAIAVVLYVV